MNAKIAVIAVGLLAAGLSGCGSDNSKLRVVEATGTVNVNGVELGSAGPVTCHRETSTTMIDTGGQDGGSTTVLNNASGLVVRSVEIRNLGGFSGTYLQDLQGDAKASMEGRTITVTGEAPGYTTEKPNERTTLPFVIKVNC